MQVPLLNILCFNLQSVQEPNLNGPVNRAGEEDLVVVGVPGNSPDWGGVGRIAEEGVGGGGGRALEYHTRVYSQQQNCFIIRLKGYASCNTCNNSPS